ncbi:hypothetical protein [Cupriavidus sp. BIS7]|uniref:hypothetical protein n=1 Tax=Cupriavidus sp. BIS7 TaxID=1217718 RepID=UPI00037751F5|nr:hypothetical protein [Cupriavidus sp. BIS7]
MVLLASAAACAEERASGPPGTDAPPPIVQDERATESAPAGTATAEEPSLVPPRMVTADDDPDLPVPVHALASEQAPIVSNEPEAVGSAGPIDRRIETYRAGARPTVMHLDDATTATGFVDGNVRSMALAMDAPLSRSGGGPTLQSRVEMAYRPGTAPVAGNWDAPPGEASATGLAVRLYGSKPTRLSGVYPFVEADWWQENRAKVININGTRIDTDMLRGLFTFNVGAHSNSITGLKLWVKAHAGRNAGGTLGARYRW